MPLRPFGPPYRIETPRVTRRVDDMTWSILADEWPATPAAAFAAPGRAWDALGNRLF